MRALNIAPMRCDYSLAGLGVIETVIVVPSAEQLQELTERWSSALARLHAAQQCLEADKAARCESGVMARAIDAATETPAELALEIARAAAASARDTAVPQVLAWLDQREFELLEADRSSSPWASRQALRYRQVKALLPRLRHWHALAMEAIAVMEADAARCRSIGDAEFALSMTRWPLPALASIAPPRAAMESTARAATVLAELRTALPEHVLSIDLEGLNDVLRRLWDLLQERTFGVRIQVTHNKHSTAGETLEVTARMLTPLAIHLGELADRAAADIEEQREQAEAFLGRYRSAARAELPITLQTLLGSFENKDGIKLAVSSELG